MNTPIPDEHMSHEPLIEKGQTKQNIVFDATTLTSIMTCGQFHDLRMNRQYASIHGKSNSLESGSIVHKFLEVFYGSTIKGVNKNDAVGFGMAAAELYIQGCPHCTGFVATEELEKPTCGHPPNEYPGLMNTPPDSTTKPNRIGWKWVLETCQQYVDYYKGDFWVPLAVEHVRRKQIYEDDNIRILWKGKLDLEVDTNQGIYPCDHKTMKQNRDVVSLNNQFKGQCVLMSTQSVIINKIGFQTSLKPDEKFKRTVVSYSSDSLYEWYSEIVPYWAYQLLSWHESGYYPFNYTQCEGKFGPCMFQDVCKADRNMRESELRQNFIIAPKWDIDNYEE